VALLAASHQRRSPEWSWRGEPPPEALRFQGWNPPPQPLHASAGQPLSTHAEPRSFSAQLAALHQTFQRTRWCRRGHRRPLLLVQLLETALRQAVVVLLSRLLTTRLLMLMALMT